MTLKQIEARQQRRLRKATTAQKKRAKRLGLEDPSRLAPPVVPERYISEAEKFRHAAKEFNKRHNMAIPPVVQMLKDPNGTSGAAFMAGTGVFDRRQPGSMHDDPSPANSQPHTVNDLYWALRKAAPKLRVEEWI